MILNSSGKAFAKINLSLDIISKMDDGYHRLETVMQTISLCDELMIECKPAAEMKITVNSNLPYIPDDGRNIAAKAANAFVKHTGITGCAIIINVNKNIPVSAGLGGGSADGACVLRMLNNMFGTSLGRESLEKLALTVGADVPFCISGGTKLAEGRGEILTDLPELAACYIVICKPPFYCSTPELFSHVRCKEIRTRPDTAGLIQAIENRDISIMARYMYNVFEDILPRGRTDIENIKCALLDGGALGAVMSGSGPTVLGLFDDKSRAEASHRQLLGIYKDCFLAQPVSSLSPESFETSQLLPNSSLRSGSKTS